MSSGGGRGPAMNARLVYLAGPMSFAGVQLISPTLPILKADLGLSTAELALIMTAYLLPAALFAIPAGFLADRWGRRRMLGWSLIAFGLSGVGFLLIDGSVVGLLSIRFIQGVAFSSILPLTITVLGDAFSGHELIRAQGYRTVSLGMGEALLPIIGGFLVGFGWEAAWAFQILALPLGVAVLARMKDQLPAGTRSMLSNGRELLSLFRRGPILSLEWIGVQRMFVKFALLSFLPVYLVEVRGFSAEFAGLLLGISATAGVMSALVTDRLIRNRSVRGWVFGSLFVVAATVVGYVLSPAEWMLLALGVIHGSADGITGVLSNSLVAVAVDGEARGSFVAATGALRNLAKALSPAVLGILVLSVPLSAALVLVGAGGMGGATVARSLGPVVRRLRVAEAG